MNATAVKCPTHQTPLDGGPVEYWCSDGHRVMAADLDHEYHPAGGQK